MDNLMEGFESNDTSVQATFALHSTGERSVTWGHTDPKGIDVLYFTHKNISREEARKIEEIEWGAKAEINRILSSYI